MDYYDNFQNSDENDLDFNNKKENNLILNEVRDLDKGFNSIFRNHVRLDGTKKKVRVDFYTSGSIGNYIRDAETGQYYNYKVGSLDEFLFFKVILATGNCTSRNKSSTLFFLSPTHYINHMGFKNLDNKIILKYEDNYNKRKTEINKSKTEINKSNTEIN